jgi:hypothetical protein
MRKLLQAGLSRANTVYYFVIMRSLLFEQSYLTINGILDFLLFGIDQSVKEKKSIKLWNFIVDKGSMQLFN